jgi:hypothetical protein
MKHLGGIGKNRGGIVGVSWHTCLAEDVCLGRSLGIATQD